MARTAKPALEKLKAAFFELTLEEAAEYSEWIENVTDVREADAAAAKRREATKTQEKAS